MKKANVWLSQLRHEICHMSIKIHSVGSSGFLLVFVALESISLEVVPIKTSTKHFQSPVSHTKAMTVSTFQIVRAVPVPMVFWQGIFRELIQCLFEAPPNTIIMTVIKIASTDPITTSNGSRITVCLASSLF